LLEFVLNANIITLNFSYIHYGQTKTRELVIINRDRGYLHGEITLSDYSQGLLLDEYVLGGNYQCFKISLEPLDKLAPGQHHNSLTIHSNGG